jgi:hypothetical protein
MGKLTIAESAHDVIDHSGMVALHKPDRMRPWTADWSYSS